MSTICRNIINNKRMKDNYFGKTLKSLRIEKGLSQRKLGEALQVVNQTISFWESGSREPDIDTLLEIAKFFQVPVSYLIDKTSI